MGVLKVVYSQLSISITKVQWQRCRCYKSLLLKHTKLLICEGKMPILVDLHRFFMRAIYGMG